MYLQDTVLHQKTKKKISCNSFLFPCISIFGLQRDLIRWCILFYVFLFCLYWIFEDCEKYYSGIFKASKKKTIIIFSTKTFTENTNKQYFSPSESSHEETKQNPQMDPIQHLENFLVEQISHQSQWDVDMWFAMG